MSESIRKYMFEVAVVFLITFAVSLVVWSKLAERELLADAVTKQQDFVAENVAPKAAVLPEPEVIEPDPVDTVATGAEVATDLLSVAEVAAANAIDAPWMVSRQREGSTPEDVLYVEVTDSCGPFHEGDCVRVRSGPGTEFETVANVRNGMVLKVGEKVATDERTWYQIEFDEWLRYPGRLTSEWYIAGEFVEEVYDAGPEALVNDTPTTSKKLVVDRSEQTLVAYEGEEEVFNIDISTGLDLSPTPRGTFTIFRKTPTRYMQGPLPYIAGSDYYDLPGVPWNLYFTEMGAVVHGAYWHNSFGNQYSHGCVNVDPDIAYSVYQWADLGTTVVVQD